MIFDIIYLILLFYATFFVIFHLILWFENRDKFFQKGKSKKLPTVSLVIPAYNEEDVIEKTLKKLRKINYPKNKLEVIVVDDGSTDETYNIAKKFESKMIRVFTKQHGGKASALNFGLKKARNEFIAVMDADSFLKKNALRNCMKYFDDEKVAAVTSHILVSNKKNFWERMQNAELMMIAVMRKSQEFANVISATPGPLSVYRKKILKKLGGFDEKNLLEDNEIAWRILKNGYRIRMAFDSIVYSVYPSSLKRWWKQRLRWTIGGLQTLSKYKSSIKGKTYAVGNFLVPTSFLGYSFTIMGIGAFIYLFTKRMLDILIYMIKAFSIGIAPFSSFEIIYYVDFKIVLGFLGFILSLLLIVNSFSLHKWKIKWYDIILYLTIYPTFYVFVILYGIYKYFKGERGWLTK